ncbi:carboxylesterase/lipase family protein [Novosphingobium jiangmenense]|uniref:carboxylesterase/lipase family protein n=1 Tax=Novosphingobium jiangmenense TaxID=2791981 RepID=UPI001FED2640|nr:carboxylesterase family protein [Novosphingobium jiangmenense]
MPGRWWKGASASARAASCAAALLAVGLPGPAAADQRTGETAVPDRPVVRTSVGPVAGRLDAERTLRMFRAIPYAAPPTGARRWRPPVPHPRWSRERDATERGPACMQNDYGWNRQDLQNMSEDCLTLDIATPLSAPAGVKLPVMVWIHGGSNRAGSSGDTIAGRLADQGVVLVSVQYRLGIFGFLAHRGLAREQGDASGNYGLMDQIAALRWVRENIAQFGGDAGNVTLFGESAGSQDVSLLLASPLASGLFRRAILQSGTPGFGMTARSLSDGLRLGDQLDGLLPRSSRRRNLDRLRALPAADLLAADLKLRDPAIWNQDYLWLRTTVDGRVLPRAPAELLAAAAPRPVIIGSNRFEFGPAPGTIDVARHLQHWFGANAEAAGKLYAAETGPATRLGPLEARIETDAVFRCPANNLAYLLARWRWPVWRYEFDVGPVGPDGSEALTTHGGEIPYVLDRRPIGTGAGVFHLQDIWLSFAREGVPRTPSGTIWSRYDAGSKAFTAITRNGMARKASLRAEICALTDRI